MTASFDAEPLDNEQSQRAWALEDYWRKIANESLAAGIAKQEDAAKQLVALTGALQGLYFAVIAFTSVREQVKGLPMLLFTLPALFWFCSLIFATRVFVPRSGQYSDLTNFDPSAWQDTQKDYIAASKTKHRWLGLSHFCLIISFFVVLTLLASLATLEPAADQGPTKIMIVTPTP